MDSNHGDNDPVVLLAVLEIEDRACFGNHPSSSSSSSYNKFHTKLRIRASEMVEIKNNSSSGGGRRRTSSFSSSSSSSQRSDCKYSYTAQQLRRRIRQHCAAAAAATDAPATASAAAAVTGATAAAMMNRTIVPSSRRGIDQDKSDDSNDGDHNDNDDDDTLEIQVLDDRTRTYVPLLLPPPTDHHDDANTDDRTTNVLARFGTRLHIRVSDRGTTAEAGSGRGPPVAATATSNNNSTESASSSVQQQQQQQLLAIRGRYFDFDGTVAIVTKSTNAAAAAPVLNFSTAHQHPIASYTTASTVWDGALLLARYLLLPSSSSVVAGKTVLELGAGCGAAGMVAAATGAAHVTLTDLPDEVSNCLRPSVDSNSKTLRDLNPNCSVVCEPCDWSQYPLADPDRVVAPPVPCCSCRCCLDASSNGSDIRNGCPQQHHQRRRPRFDVILVADCVWLEDLVDPLLAVLKQLTDDPNELVTKEEKMRHVSDGTATTTPYPQCESRNDDDHDELTWSGLAMGDDSFSHLDLLDEKEAEEKASKPKKEGENNNSPVNSWADISGKGNNNSGSSINHGSVRSTDDETSFSSLAEPPPDPCVVARRSNHTHKLVQHNNNNNPTGGKSGASSVLRDGRSTDVHNSEETVTASTSTVPTSNTGADRASPTVLISYQRRGRAAHEAFKKGLHTLFSRVEVLRAPDLDMPDVFYLLSCQR
jgi:predicted nicotinamide N-methyase